MNRLPAGDSRHGASPVRRSVLAVGLVVALFAAVLVLAPLRSDWVAPPGILPVPNLAIGVTVDERFFGAVTALGDGGGLVAIVGLATLALIVQGRGTDAAFVVAAVTGTALLSRVVKDVYDLPRPPTVGLADGVAVSIPAVAVAAVVGIALAAALVARQRPRVVIGTAFVLVLIALEVGVDRLLPLTRGFDSFPSGHAAGSMALASAVALVAWRRPRNRWPIVLVAGGYVLAVGVSRVYLSVHYPADVLAGWCLAAGWSLLLWLAWPRLVAAAARLAGARRDT